MRHPPARTLDSARSVGVLVLLTAIGYLGNYARVPLFFNVDFLFGSLFALIIVQVYGVIPGMVAAAIISTHTYLLWQHPYAVVIMTLEAGFVGMLMHYRVRNIVLADAVYWLIIGMPLVGLFYHLVMEVSPPSSYLIAFKQAINGIVNAVLASAVVAAVDQFTPWISGRTDRRGVGFREVLFLVMVTLVLVPAVLIMVATARQEMTRVEESVQQRLSITAAAAKQSVEDWLTENFQTLRSLAVISELVPDNQIPQVTEEAELLLEADRDFDAITVVGDNGDLIAMTPEALPALHGVDYTGLPYFSRLIHGMYGVASNVIVPADDAQGTTQPIVTLAVPVQRGGDFRGAVVGLVNLERLAEVLERITSDWRINAVIIDANERVVASTDPEARLFSSYRRHRGEGVTYLDRSMYLRLAGVDPNVSIMERWQDSEYGTREPLGSGAEWQLILRAPVAPYEDELNDRYRRLLMVMLVLVIVTIALASLLSRWLISSIADLNAVTRGLPEKVTRNERLSWPRSYIAEIDSLIHSFKVTTSHLSDSFSRIQATNDALLEAKREADAANQTKSQFLANISHDLRTPLNGILGYAQILKRDTQLDQATRDAVRIIERSGNHLLNLINDILDVSRIEANKLVLEIAPFRLDAFLEDVGDLITLQAQAKGLSFSRELGDSLPTAVLGDETRLRQILLNLLNNAVKFTDHGSIVLRAHPVGAALRFEVEDTGSGIPEEQLEEIFSPFKQLERRVQSEEGTGLGLAIVQRLVAMMDGQVHVESTPGQGSRFWFDVALPPAPETPADDRMRRVVTSYHGRRRRILIVDDKAENRSVIKAMLVPLGFAVVEASDGEEGLTLMRSEHPDIVLMDLVMPGLDGFEAVRLIRDDQALKDTTVIAVSASVALAIREECLRVGFDDFLPKPFSESDLLDQLRTHLDLQWSYAEQAVAPPAVDRPVNQPPPESLEPLRCAVNSGDIRSVVSEAERLQLLDQRYAGFAAKVIELARDFQISRLRRVIDECVECTDE
jgi:signal transduction histidine kinase/DNA-binding response OmpR family regulator